VVLRWNAACTYIPGRSARSSLDRSTSTRSVRAFRSIDLLVAGRRLMSVPGAKAVPGVVVDIGAPDFAQRLRALSPELVIHCVGPFQGQGYGVAKAALAAGAHYLDLADGRQFIAEFAASMNALDTAFGGS